jgi:nickel/cobalt transporter (NicO) family protein
MRRLILRIALAIGLMLTLAGRAEAHPLGNFTVNQYSQLVVGPEQILVHYVVDMAEIPAFQAIQELDTNQDSQLSDAERQAYIDAQRAALPTGITLEIDGASVPLTVTGHDLSFPAGQGGLSTLRLTLDMRAERPTPGARAAISYRVENFAERLGWREIVVQATDGVTLAETNVPSTTVSDQLRSYPADSLSSPLDLREARVTAAPGGPAANTSGAQLATGRASSRADDQLAALIASRELTPGAILVALLLAFVLGAGHALTPGHGKTIVAAYLVGARGTARHALFLGLTTTLTHTAGVFLLGFVTLAISKYVLPEQIYPWLEFVSGVMVVVIGVALFRSRLMALLRRNRVPAHGHDHNHDHSHDHGHVHGPDTHTHDYDAALADWAAGDRAGASAAQPAVTWKSLLALGISGGLIPCPSALVVLLGAIALGRVGFGMLLIVAFSAGLAAVLTALGMLLVYARGWFERLPTSGLLMRALPVASAVLVTLAGCVITVGGLVQTGIVRI